MSVAESMVILGPIDQLGCASACSGVTAARSAALRPRKGPPDPVSSSSSSARLSPASAGHAGAGASAGDALEQRAVLAVHGQDRRAAAAGGVQDERPAGDHALLVGQRERRAGLERRHGGAQPGGADDAVEHHQRRPFGGGALGGAGDELADPGFAGVHRELRRQRRGLRRRVRVVQAHVAHAVRERLRDDAGGVTPGRQADEAQPRHRRQHLERLAADRAGRAEDEQVSGGRFGHGRKGTTPRPQRRGRRARTSITRLGRRLALDGVPGRDEHRRILEPAALGLQIGRGLAGRLGQVHDEGRHLAVAAVVAHGRLGQRRLGVGHVQLVGVGGDLSGPVQVVGGSLGIDRAAGRRVAPLSARSAAKRSRCGALRRGDGDAPARVRTPCAPRGRPAGAAVLELHLERQRHQPRRRRDRRARARTPPRPAAAAPGPRRGRGRWPPCPAAARRRSGRSRRRSCTRSSRPTSSAGAQIHRSSRAPSSLRSAGTNRYRYGRGQRVDDHGAGRVQRARRGRQPERRRREQQQPAPGSRTQAEHQQREHRDGDDVPLVHEQADERSRRPRPPWTCRRAGRGDGQGRSCSPSCVGGCSARQSEHEAMTGTTTSAPPSAQALRARHARAPGRLALLVRRMQRTNPAPPWHGSLAHAEGEEDRDERRHAAGPSGRRRRRARRPLPRPGRTSASRPGRRPRPSGAGHEEERAERVRRELRRLEQDDSHEGSAHQRGERGRQGSPRQREHDAATTTPARGRDAARRARDRRRPSATARRA